MSSTPAQNVVAALQEALDREHAAVYGYAVVGAHLDGRQQARATAHLNAHRAARDQLDALIRANEAKPHPAAASYRLPMRITGPAKAKALAAELERATLGAYSNLVAASGRRIRRHAVRAMQDAADRQAQWSGTIDPLPGLRT